MIICLLNMSELYAVYWYRATRLWGENWSESNKISLLTQTHTSSYLFVSADAGRTAEVELRFFDRQRVTGVWVAVTVKAAAFTAVHGELPHFAPSLEAGVTTESVQATLMGDLMLYRLWDDNKNKQKNKLVDKKNALTRHTKHTFKQTVAESLSMTHYFIFETIFKADLPQHLRFLLILILLL